MNEHGVSAANRAREDLRLGWGAPFDALAVAALVALPFSGALAILISQATWWPSLVMIPLTGVFQGVLTFWIAGIRRRAAGVTDSQEH